MRIELLAAFALTVFSASSAAQPAEQPAEQIAGNGFNTVPVGPLMDLTTGNGRWTAAAGEASIESGRGRERSQALRLTGGEGSSVLWTPDLADAAPVELVFWAQRWTRQDPFDFQISAQIAGQWQVLFADSAAVPVGRYERFVIPWPAGRVEQLRLSCSSPADRGVLLDDIAIHRAVPMRIEAVTAEQPVTPALIGSQFSPILRINVQTTGNRQLLSVRRVRVALTGTTHLGDIQRLELRSSGAASQPNYQDAERFFAHAQPLGEPAESAAAVTFSGELELASGQNTFWLTATLAPDADHAGTIHAQLEALETSDGQVHRVNAPVASRGQRIGVALRNSGQDGVAAYRIPGLVTTNRGTLIAVYDIRRDGWGDLPADIDVGMSRSTDGGRTWEPMRVIMDLGNDRRWLGDGVGDPSVLVDRQTGTIWVAGVWSHGNQGFHGSRPGLDPEETAQLMLVRSDDDGLTWSDPINITRQVKDPDWRLLLQGPGCGITTRKGLLVFPAQFVDADGLPHATLIHSRDRGETWQIGTSARSNTTEAQVVELADGTLMLNMRDNRGGSRAVAVSDDLGQTWKEHPTNRAALPEPVCQASLISITPHNLSRPDYRAGADWLVFSNPAVAGGPRRNLTIKGSVDQGMSWPATHQLLIDEGISAGYSCLTRIDEQTLGILFEGSLANMVFMRIPLADVFPEAD